MHLFVKTSRIVNVVYYTGLNHTVVFYKKS